MSNKERESSSVSRIFRTMSYGEDQGNHSSAVLDWLSAQGNKICSTISGKKIEGSAPSKFIVGGRHVTLSCVGVKEIGPILKSKSEGAKEEVDWDEKGANERLEKLENLVKSITPLLACAEGMGTSTPCWQVLEKDVPNWDVKEWVKSPAFAEAKRALELRSKKPGSCKAVEILMRLEVGSSYSLQSLLGAITLGIFFQGKFLLSISPSSSFASASLPVAFLVDALNRAGIRKTPIDLLVLDAKGAEEAIESLVNFGSGDPLLWGVDGWGIKDWRKKLGVRLGAGVLVPERIPVQHFVLDSSADMKSAVEAIAEEVWCSGSKVNWRARSVLFVHQPVYKDVIEFLGKKVEALRVSEDHHKSTDFITRTQTPDLQKELLDLQKLGVKMFPASSTLIKPTLIYEIGTSTSLLASKSWGMGHLLCIIPYRSVKELLSLANNQGPWVHTQIHASDSATIKQIVGNIKGEFGIRVNWSGKGGNTSTNIANSSWLLLHGHKEEEESPSRKKDGFLSADVEKAVESWGSLDLLSRIGIAEKVLRSAMPEDEGARLRIEVEIMKLTTINGKESESVVVRRRPVGIMGIIFQNPGRKVDMTSLLLPILSGLLKGNALVVGSTGDPLPNPIVQACNSNLPPGLLNFINSSSLTELLTSFQNKVEDVTVFLNENEGEMDLSLDTVLGLGDNARFATCTMTKDWVKALGKTWAQKVSFVQY